MTLLRGNAAWSRMMAMLVAALLFICGGSLAQQEVLNSSVGNATGGGVAVTPQGFDLEQCPSPRIYEDSSTGLKLAYCYHFSTVTAKGLANFGGGSERSAMKAMCGRTRMFLNMELIDANTFSVNSPGEMNFVARKLEELGAALNSERFADDVLLDAGKGVWWRDRSDRQFLQKVLKLPTFAEDNCVYYSRSTGRIAMKPCRNGNTPGDENFWIVCKAIQGRRSASVRKKRSPGIGAGFGGAYNGAAGGLVGPVAQGSGGAGQQQRRLFDCVHPFQDSDLAEVFCYHLVPTTASDLRTLNGQSNWLAIKALCGRTEVILGGEVSNANMLSVNSRVELQHLHHVVEESVKPLDMARVQFDEEVLLGAEVGIRWEDRSDPSFIATEVSLQQTANDNCLFYNVRTKAFVVNPCSKTLPENKLIWAMCKARFKSLMARPRETANRDQALRVGQIPGSDHPNSRGRRVANLNNPNFRAGKMRRKKVIKVGRMSHKRNNSAAFQADQKSGNKGRKLEDGQTPSKSGSISEGGKMDGNKPHVEENSVAPKHMRGEMIPETEQPGDSEFHEMEKREAKRKVTS